jgi:hypothetical protein
MPPKQRHPRVRFSRARAQFSPFAAGSVWIAILRDIVSSATFQPTECLTGPVLYFRVRWAQDARFAGEDSNMRVSKPLGAGLIALIAITGATVWSPTYADTGTIRFQC